MPPRRRPGLSVPPCFLREPPFAGCYNGQHLWVHTARPKRLRRLFPGSRHPFLNLRTALSFRTGLLAPGEWQSMNGSPALGTAGAYRMRVVFSPPLRRNCFPSPLAAGGAGSSGSTLCIVAPPRAGGSSPFRSPHTPSPGPVARAGQCFTSTAAPDAPGFSPGEEDAASLLSQNFPHVVT